MTVAGTTHPFEFDLLMTPAALGTLSVATPSYSAGAGVVLLNWMQGNER
jgi:hypothetical protein